MHDDDYKGKPNKLAKETSPYLLQHAYNPVEWYAWSEEALERAKKEDKPIFLSVGYSACHWCHVMAHDSFEDEEVAKVMNENFINIKVDREERPDIDDIYQRICQLATGTGGWPLSVFLTPDQKPFYAGTFFPKDGRKYGIPGFMIILQQLSAAFKIKKNEINAASVEFMDALLHTAKDVVLQDMSRVSLDRSILDEAAVGLLQMGDTIYGGFGQAPKFPNTLNLLYLLRYFDFSGINRFRDFVIFTADRMIAGGIHDQLGGGFARYSTDQKWLAPHFEKMLYDNALLVQLYAEIFQITKDEKYLTIVRKTLDFIIREMMHPDGGFFSAQDADSEGEEGKFYLWTKKEIQEILLDNEAVDCFCEYYGVTEGGNFEFKNILNVQTSFKNIAQHTGKTSEQIEKIVAEASLKLLARREKRIRPGRDEKVLTSWNGLMISALVKGYAVTSDEKYIEAARKAVDFIEEKLASSDGRLLRTFRDSQSKLNAYLDDYAFYASSLLDMFAIYSKPQYLEKAEKYTDFMVKHFWDENDGSFYFTSDDHEHLIVRTKNFYDLATPSGNSVAASNLLRLYHYIQKENFLDMATRILKSGAKLAAENPFGFGQFLMALYLYIKKPVEVTIISNGENAMTRRLNSSFLPDGITATISEVDLPALEKFAFFQDKSSGGKETAFVCRNFACSLPIKSEKELAQQLWEQSRFD